MSPPLTPEVQISTSRRGYLVALGLVVASVAIAGIFMWWIYNVVAAMPRIEARGEHTVDLPSGELVVFGELEGGNTDASFECGAKDAAGAPLKLESVGSTTTSYDMGSYRGQSVFNLTVPTSGPVTIRCESDADMRLAFGKSFATRLFAGAGLALLTFLSGCYAVIRTFRRRRRERKARSTAP